MGNTLQAAAIFLINTLFDLYLFVLIIRLVLVFKRADYFNPLTQLTVKLTQFLVNPLRRILPNIKRIETATLVLVLLLAALKFYILIILSYGTTPHVAGLFLLALAECIRMGLNLFFYAILIQALLGWFLPYSPLNTVLIPFTEVVLRPMRRILPTVGGFDLSPIPVMIILQLLIILLVNPLATLGMGVALP